jgi:ABC-type transport system involved in multi-copper enzyme maturation permease subunit
MTTTTPYQHSTQRAVHNRFLELLWAEWTKFRTVSGWVIGMAAAVLLTVMLSLLASSGSHLSANGRPGTQVPTVPVGPGGEAVTDTFYMVRQPVSGNGSITVRVTSLVGVPSQSYGEGAQPWAKAGLIIKTSTAPGSPYAAIMVTPSHGVRMQYNFTHDIAGTPGAVSAASPRWLRLTRSGAAVTGYESADGRHWTMVGSADLAGLPSVVQAGLFVASPDFQQASNQQLGGSTVGAYQTQAIAAFDRVGLQGAWSRGAWLGDDIGGQVGSFIPSGQQGGKGSVGSSAAGSAGLYPTAASGFTESGGRFTITGSGDIAPAVPPGPDSLEQSLAGAFVGLIVVIAVGAAFITAEYRRGMIRTTFAASPRRGQVVAAKVIVLGSITFVAGLVAAIIGFLVGQRAKHSDGVPTYAIPALTDVRAVAGTAALLAVAAILALAMGTVLRRSVGAVAAVIAAIVLPYLLVITSALPVGASQWLLRVTPAAAFAIQQGIPQYHQVNSLCLPSYGCYPLTPWRGFGVLCAYAAVALGVAIFLVRRRDA